MNALAVIVAVSADVLAVTVIVAACVALRHGLIDGQLTVRAVPPWKRSGPGPKSAPRAGADDGDPS